MINIIKYRKAIKAFRSHKSSTTIPNFNIHLRFLGFNISEIDEFWKSSSELKAFLKCYESEQSFLNSDEFYLESFEKWEY